MKKCIEVIVADLLDNFMNIGSLFKIIFLIVFWTEWSYLGDKTKKCHDDRCCSFNFCHRYYLSIYALMIFSFRKNFIKWFHRSCIDIDMYLIIDNSLSLKFKNIF